MTELIETVTGEIAKIVVWKTGKGFFLSIMDNSNDFYAFGKCNCIVGDMVTLACKEGTGSFSDKILISKMIKVTIKKADVPKNPLADVPNGAQIYLTKAEADAVRQNSIERQCALKSAVDLVGELYPRATLIDNDKIEDLVLRFAQTFFDWIACNEPELPEPPEEK
jgi:hypothetical protein